MSQPIKEEILKLISENINEENLSLPDEINTLIKQKLQKLRPKMRDDPYNIFANPHAFSGYTRDILLSIKTDEKLNEHPELIENPTIIIDDSIGEENYSSKYFSTSIHWGQRKLFFSELEFLILYTSCNDKKDVLIYAGAAPGKHIPILADFFKSVYFILVDPEKFNCSKRNNIRIINDYFTDEIALSLKTEFPEEEFNILFFSDIRSEGPGQPGFEEKLKGEVEAQIVNDHYLQWGWIKMMNPVISSFKFRLPYCSDIKKNSENEEIFTSLLQKKYPQKIFFPSVNKLKYVDGVVFVQLWAPTGSTETRLAIFDPNSSKNWDYSQYEKRLAYFNHQIRRKLHYIDEHYLLHGEGLDCCQDCQLEIKILEEFYRQRICNKEWKNIEKMMTLSGKRLYRFSRKDDSPEVKMMNGVINLSHFISISLTGGKRTLRDFQPADQNYRGKLGHISHSTRAPSYLRR